MGFLQNLFNDILASGKFPRQLRRLSGDPVDKPGREAYLCKKRRPISLLCVLAKFFEDLAYNLLVVRSEERLEPRQFAYMGWKGERSFTLLRFATLSAALDTKANVSSLHL